MHARIAALAAAILLTATLLSGCNAACTDEPSIFCSNNPPQGVGGEPPAGFGCQGLPGENLWECNVDSALGMQLPGVAPPVPGMCGVVPCAADVSGAKAQVAALAGVSPDDPRLICISLGTTLFSVNSGLTVASQQFNAPGAVCVDKEGPGCNPCDDGQGGTLQNVGEHCGGLSMCCQGLTCVGATASEMGTCAGTPQCPPTDVEKYKQACDKANADCIANCPQGDKSCMNNCNHAYGTCLKDCENQ